MNFSRHLVIVILLVLVLLLVVGFWATSIASPVPNGAQTIEAILGIPKDSYHVIPSSTRNATHERSTFISEIRTILRSQPEIIEAEDVDTRVPPPVEETAPVIIPVPEPIPQIPPEPVTLPIAGTTTVTQEEVHVLVE
jgi:hypothetical protein